MACIDFLKGIGPGQGCIMELCAREDIEKEILVAERVCEEVGHERMKEVEILANGGLGK